MNGSCSKAPPCTRVFIHVPCCCGWAQASLPPVWSASSAHRTFSSRSNRKHRADTACLGAPTSTTGRSCWLHTQGSSIGYFLHLLKAHPAQLTVATFTGSAEAGSLPWAWGCWPRWARCSVQEGWLCVVAQLVGVRLVTGGKTGAQRCH